MLMDELFGSSPLEDPVALAARKARSPGAASTESERRVKEILEDEVDEEGEEEDEDDEDEEAGEVGEDEEDEEDEEDKEDEEFEEDSSSSDKDEEPVKPPPKKAMLMRTPAPAPVIAKPTLDAPVPAEAKSAAPEPAAKDESAAGSAAKEPAAKKEEVEEGRDQGDEVGGDQELEEAISLAALPPAHLKPLHDHVCKANVAGFYASDSNIMPVRLPLKATDGSTAYVLIAYMLTPTPPERAVRSRAAVSKEGLADLTMGRSMVDADGVRFRLVANILVHATTAASRAELQVIFGMQSFKTWLVILDNPDYPGLVLEPAHVLQRIADATEAEIKRYKAPLDADGKQLESRGTLWILSLLNGAQTGSTDSVAPLRSMKESMKEVQAAAKVAAIDAAKVKAAAKVVENEAVKAEVAARKMAREADVKERARKAAVTAAEDKAATKPKKTSPRARTPKAQLSTWAEAPAAATTAEDKEEEEDKEDEEDEEDEEEEEDEEDEEDEEEAALEATHVPFQLGAECWYTPNAGTSKGPAPRRRRITIKSMLVSRRGDIRYTFEQPKKGKVFLRSVPGNLLVMIHPENISPPKAKLKAVPKAELKAEPKAKLKAEPKAESKA